LWGLDVKISESLAVDGYRNVLELISLDDRIGSFKTARMRVIDRWAKELTYRRGGRGSALEVSAGMSHLFHRLLCGKTVNCQRILP